METCECRGLPEKDEIVLTLECLDCKGGVVTCRQCGRPEWWPESKRKQALNSAEAHRWEMGHTLVVVRGFGGRYGGQVVMEVGDE